MTVLASGEPSMLFRIPMYMRTYSVLLYKCPCICIAYEFIVFWVFFFNIPQLCAMQYNAAGGSARNILPPQLCYNVELSRAGGVILQRWSCFLMKPYPRENNCRFQGDPRRTAGCFKKFLALAFVQNSHEILEMQLLLSA